MVGSEDTPQFTALGDRHTLTGGMPGQGKSAAGWALWADLFAELAAVTAERDALAEDLAYELNATRTGGDR